MGDRDGGEAGASGPRAEQPNAVRCGHGEQGSWRVKMSDALRALSGYPPLAMLTSTVLTGIHLLGTSD